MTKKMSALAEAQQEAEQYADAIRDIYDLVQESGTTRADMQETLDSIAGLCEEAVEDLDQTDGSDDDEETEE